MIKYQKVIYLQKQQFFTCFSANLFLRDLNRQATNVSENMFPHETQVLIAQSFIFLTKIKFIVRIKIQQLKSNMYICVKINLLIFNTMLTSILFQMHLNQTDIIHTPLVQSQKIVQVSYQTLQNWQSVYHKMTTSLAQQQQPMSVETTAMSLSSAEYIFLTYKKFLYYFKKINLTSFISFKKIYNVSLS